MNETATFFRPFRATKRHDKNARKNNRSSGRGSFHYWSVICTCRTLQKHNIIYDQYTPLLLNQLIEIANCREYDRFKAIIADSNKRQSLSHCVRELDNMYPYARRILIISCWSILVIYPHAIRQSSALLSAKLSRTFACGAVSHKRIVYELIICQSSFIEVAQAVSTAPKNPVGDTEGLKSAFIQWCVRTVSILASLSCHPPSPRLSTWAQVSADGKIPEYRADSSRISARSSIYDSYSSG